MSCPQCGSPLTGEARLCVDCRSNRRMTDLGLATAAAGARADAPAYPAEQSLPGFIERIRNILLSPKSEWLAIEAEPTSISQLYAGYVVPMAAFAALMSFIRMSIIGVD